MAMKTKIGYGNRNDVAQSIADGVLDAGDIIATKDTEELIFIRPNNEQMILKSRTQEDIAVKGVTSLGVEDNEVIPAGKSLDEIVALLVQKPVSAEYTQPSVVVSNEAEQMSDFVEAGTTLTPKFQVTFVQNDAGALSKLEILRGEEVVGESASSPYTYTGTPIVVDNDELSFTVRATYGEGEIKNNNLDQPSPEGHIEAGSIDSDVYTIAGKRNLFYGSGTGNMPDITSDLIRGLSHKVLDPKQGLTFNVALTTGEQYVVIAYPATLPDLTQIRYLETGDSSMLGMFDHSLVDVADARGGNNGLVSYKVYTLNMPVPTAAKMTFEVTI